MNKYPNNRHPVLDKYIELCGAPKRAAQRLDITEGALYHMLNGRRNITPRMAERIEADTNGLIRKETLVWPELAEN